jgi:hypothetical protein
MALATPHQQILQIHLYYKNNPQTKAKKGQSGLLFFAPEGIQRDH